MTTITTPRILVAGFECLDDGSRRPLGMLDLTEKLSEELMYRRVAHPSPDTIPVRSFAGGLAQDVSDIAWDGRLAIPGLGKALDAFVDAIGGIGMIKTFRDHLRGIGIAERALEKAVSVRDTVAAAIFVPYDEALKTSGMFYSEYVSGDEGYVDEPGNAYGMWKWDEYVRRNPRPRADFESPEMKAWEDAYEAWVQERTPPVVFCTATVDFVGISAASIREEFDDEKRVNVENLLESACGDHHDGAHEQIVDEGALYDIVEKWLPHAGKGTVEDLALEGLVEAWNARQTLQSFMYDPSRYTGTSPDTDAVDIASWCEANVERATAALEEAKVWAVVEPSAAPRAA